MLDLMPFCRLSWNSPQLANEWSETLQVARDLCHHVEYQMVKQGFRKANVFHMQPHQFDIQIDKITNDGLVFLPILRSKSYSGFSHKHYPVKQLDAQSFVFGVVAKDLETAKKFKHAALTGDHITQGLLLGYPECCCKTFTDVWIKKRALDPCYESAMNTEGREVIDGTVHITGHPYLNQMLRYFSIRVAPFFPCSFKCERGIQVAKVWDIVLRAFRENVTKKMIDLLNLPLTWDMYKSIIYIKTPLFKGVVNGYDCKERKVIVWNGSN